MSNPNLVKVWSPTGELIETSRANARDLTTHAGWLSSPPVIIEKVVVVEKEVPANEVGETKTETPAAPAPEEVTETAPAEEEAPAADEDAGEEDEADAEADADSEDAPTIRKTEEDFADLTERADVVAYLAEAFPAFKPHHLTKRDGLVTKAIELANG